MSVVLGGHPALSAVDLCVARGEALALVGPSGSGKTTLLRLLNAALAPTAGTLWIEGRAPFELTSAELRALRARIGCVHQGLALVPNVRVAQNVLAGRSGRRGLFSSLRALLWPAQAELAEAHRVLERLGIGDKLFLRTDTLSGGEEQRVAIARALFQEPIALLADEPVASVDPARARGVIELLTGLAAERGMTLVVSLHDMALARAAFPRIVGLRAGRVVFDRAPAELEEADYDALYRLAPEGAL